MHKEKIELQHDKTKIHDREGLNNKESGVLETMRYSPNITKAKITLAAEPIMRRSLYAGMMFKRPRPPSQSRCMV